MISSTSSGADTPTFPPSPSTPPSPKFSAIDEQATVHDATPPPTQIEGPGVTVQVEDTIAVWLYTGNDMTDTTPTYSLLECVPLPRQELGFAHPSKLLDTPTFEPGSSSKLLEAANKLHAYPTSQRRRLGLSPSNKECVCLTWCARKLGTEGFNAAIAFYKRSNPGVTQIGEVWIDAQQLILERVAKAQWTAYDDIRMKTGTVLDKLDHSDMRLPFDEGDEGHVQPWMAAKLRSAISEAAVKAFIDIDKNLVGRSLCSDVEYRSFSLDNFYKGSNEDDSVNFPCLCKEHCMTQAAENEINGAHYRLEVGVTPLINEENAMEKAQDRATAFIMEAAQDAMMHITEKGDHEHNCRKNDTVHMKTWMRWHVEWKCHKAEREFQTLMRRDPNRESNTQLSQRHDAANEKAEAERIKHPNDEDEAIDERWSTIDMGEFGTMPYPGCECLLWGVSQMANEAWNEATSSFEDVCPVASDWGCFLEYGIREASERALDEIRHVVSKGDVGRVVEGVDGESRDHFPEWQQCVVRRWQGVAVDRAKETIRANGGAPGPVAEAAASGAEERYRQLQLSIAAGEGLQDEEGWS